MALRGMSLLGRGGAALLAGVPAMPTCARMTVYLRGAGMHHRSFSIRGRQQGEKAALTLIGCASAFALYGNDPFCPGKPATAPLMQTKH